MQVIALTGNNLTGMLPKTICDHLPDLEGLYLGRNSLDGVIPPNLEKCRKLQILELTENEIAGTVPRELANLTTLTGLFLMDLHLEGSVNLLPFLFSAKIILIYFPKIDRRDTNGAR